MFAAFEPKIAEVQVPSVSTPVIVTNSMPE
jgi:hypothetical protein